MGLAAVAERPAIGTRFDPLDAAYLDDPYPYLAEAREAAPVFYADLIAHWIVTRHRDIKQIFREPPTFSAVNANAPLSPPCLMAAKALEEGGWGAVPTLANVDPPVHTRVRRIANIAFTPKRVAEMEGFVRDLTVRFCSERLRDGRADLVRDLAWELPVLVLFRILGVGAHEVSRVKEGSWNRILFIYGRPSESKQVKAAEGMARFWSLAEQLVADRTAAPRDDFVSTLVHTPDVEGKTLTRQQAATVVLNLLFAGHETTTGLIGNMFNRLLADRQAWSDIIAEPALIPNAVEEILRLDSSVVAWRRRTTRATEIGGVPCSRGGKPPDDARRRKSRSGGVRRSGSARYPPRQRTRTSLLRRWPASLPRRAAGAAAGARRPGRSVVSTSDASPCKGDKTRVCAECLVSRAAFAACGVGRLIKTREER